MATAPRLPPPQQQFSPPPPPSSSLQQQQPPGKKPVAMGRYQRRPETVEVICNGVNGTLIIADQTVVCGCSSCMHLGQSSRTMSCTQFEIHSGAGGKKKWKYSIKVRPGTEPEVPRNGSPMPVGKWFELKGVEVAAVEGAGQQHSAQFGGARPGFGSPPVAAAGAAGSKVPLQYQWKGGPGGGGFMPVGAEVGGGGGVGGGAFAPPSSLKGTGTQQQKYQKNQQQPNTQYFGGPAQRYSAAAVAERQQERAAAAAAAAVMAVSRGPAPIGRPPASGQYRNLPVSAVNTALPAGKMGQYTPWRDATDGKFSSINVKWSGERCSVCDADTDFDYDQLVTCDMCGITVHQSCYGVQDVPGVEQMWFCRACELHDSENNSSGQAPLQCCLCPVAGGALKPTTIQGIWAHVACLQWIPEVSVDNTDLMEPISGIRSIERDRWELLCYVCKQRMGAKIQCKSCYNAYHPLCARIAGFRMEIKDGPRGPDGPVVCTSYCGKHSVPQPQLAGVRKVEESEAGGDLPDELEKPRLWNCQPYPLPRCLPVPDCAAGCARAMQYDLFGRGLVRKQHGCGTGATTEAAFWIPGSVFELSDEEAEEEQQQQQQQRGTEKATAAVEVEVEGEGKKEKDDPMEEDDDASRHISRRTKNKRLYSSGPGLDDAEQKEEDQEGIKAETDTGKVGGAAIIGLGWGSVASETPTKPTDVAANKAKDTTLIQRVESPPGMHTVETSLRPAMKKPSSNNGERPPAKLRKLNSLHADEKSTSFAAADIAAGTLDKAAGEAAAASAGAPASHSLLSGLLPAELVGRWCRVWWPEDSEWYLGVIREYSPTKGQFRVWYEVDNEAEWIDLGRESRNNRVQLLDGDVRSNWPGPLPAPKSDGKTAKAENLNGSNVGNEDEEEEYILVCGPAEGAAAIGRKVNIYREESSKRYACGTVRNYRADKGHLILYENGTADWIDLSTSRIEWKDMKMPTNVNRRVSTSGSVPPTNDDNGVDERSQLAADGADGDVKNAADIDKHIAVVCNGVRGIFHSKTLSVTMTHSGKDVTPGEFERISGRGSAKKWKATIRLDTGEGRPGKTIESWLIDIGVWDQDGKPWAGSVKYYSGNRLVRVEEDLMPRPTKATLDTYANKKRRPVRVANNTGKSAHKGDCSCVICKQSRRTGNKWSGFTGGGGGGDNNKHAANAQNLAAAAAAQRAGQLRGSDNNTRHTRNTELRHGPDTFRTGKQAYLEAIPQIISTGPRSLELYKAPPSRCWAPGEWAAHRLRYNMAREAKLAGQNKSLASLAQSTAPLVVISGGSLAIQTDNYSTVVSLGPGATGGGRTSTLKEKLDLCNATEHERLSFGKSGIHGWGLFAKVPMRQDTMVVEFRGELLRKSASETREAKYVAQGVDCYIFNLDDDVVLDATKAGTIARFTVRMSKEDII